jgi:signal-transduction protein with cAMP-binding, CBS, and nucleotidyltransferase domain
LRQATSIDGINEYLIQINQVAQNAVSVSNKTAAASEGMSAQVEILWKKLSFFRTTMSSVSPIDLLNKDNFSDLPRTADMDKIPSTPRNFVKDDIIIREGERDADIMYFIMYGSVKVFKSYGEPSEMLLAILNPGELFGEMALFLEEPRSATVVALNDVVVLEITHDNLDMAMESNPNFTKAMVETLCERLGDVLKNYAM